GYCEAAQDFQDARRVCRHLDLPLHRVNFSAQYKERVFADFLDELRRGRTPNPDVLCNREIKFGTLRKYARRPENERLRQEALRLIRGFWETSGPDFGKPLYLEKRFMIDMGDVRLEGVVDRVEHRSPGTVEVIDYKSGFAPDRNTAERNLQLLIYALACREVWSLRPERVSLHYLATNSVHSWALTESDIDEARQRVAATAQYIRGEAFNPRTGPHCRQCDYLRSCSFGQAWIESDGRQGTHNAGAPPGVS
ncbi:MAG: PD-(D/E)XK nuclease family protein, partial [Chloroflexi bacterium]|nr:PD-(D/E)XK nuclease family protein [Chloroflexota bacterium]